MNILGQMGWAERISASHDMNKYENSKDMVEVFQFEIFLSVMHQQCLVTVLSHSIL